MLLCIGQSRRSAHVLAAFFGPASAFGGARADKIALDTSANPPRTAIIKRPVLLPVSARRSPSVVIMKSQPGRSPPMRQATSLGPWPRLPMPITIASPPIRPTTAHRDRRTAPRECRTVRRRVTPRGCPRFVGRMSRCTSCATVNGTALSNRGPAQPWPRPAVSPPSLPPMWPGIRA